ncbi:hypothetical protein PV797_14880 [Clostridiaceae bacterium M8S5]|nr:hypothetical protein PV797_14880 [Clostridiaceae bacterium M8S5]
MIGMKNPLTMALFYSRPMARNGALTNKVAVLTKNEGFVTADKAQVFIESTIPPGMILSQITITPEEFEYEMRMLGNGKFLVTVDLPEILPNEDVMVTMDVYFAGELTAPSYKLDTTAASVMKDELQDAKASNVVMDMEPEIDLDVWQ